MVVQNGQNSGHVPNQGVDILEFLLVSGNIQRLKDGLEYITEIDEDTTEKIRDEHREGEYDSKRKIVCECGLIKKRYDQCSSIAPDHRTKIKDTPMDRHKVVPCSGGSYLQDWCSVRNAQRSW